MRYLRLLVNTVMIAVVVSFIISGCTTIPIEKNITAVPVGMTEKDVISVLGKPLSRDQQKNRTCLRYRTSDKTSYHYVLIVDGKVKATGAGYRDAYTAEELQVLAEKEKQLIDKANSLKRGQSKQAVLMVMGEPSDKSTKDKNRECLIFSYGEHEYHVMLIDGALHSSGAGYKDAYPTAEEVEAERKIRLRERLAEQRKQEEKRLEELQAKAFSLTYDAVLSELGAPYSVVDGNEVFIAEWGKHVRYYDGAPSVCACKTVLTFSKETKLLTWWKYDTCVGHQESLPFVPRLIQDYGNYKMSIR